MAIIYNNKFERPEEKPEAPKPREKQEPSWKGFAKPYSMEEDDEQSDNWTIVADHNLVVARCAGGWCIAEKACSSVVPLSHPWPSQEQAEAFLAIARPDLGFIPSSLKKAP